MLEIAVSDCIAVVDRLPIFIHLTAFESAQEARWHHLDRVASLSLFSHLPHVDEVGLILGPLNQPLHLQLLCALDALLTEHWHRPTLPLVNQNFTTAIGHVHQQAEPQPLIATYQALLSPCTFNPHHLWPIRMRGVHVVLLALLLHELRSTH